MLYVSYPGLVKDSLVIIAKHNFYGRCQLYFSKGLNSILILCKCLLSNIEQDGINEKKSAL